MTDCIFCKIASGTIQTKVLFEDAEMMAFHDHRPQAPVHFLIIPKRHISSLQAILPTDAALLGHLLVMVKPLAEQMGLHQGYRTFINTGPAGGQEVYHLHIHVMGTPLPALAGS